ncbi:MAG: DUF3179 domain-containing protein [Proteobacteria bacterium]|nr:DUF3179 domain-containing protein [Pseudomonadota bacterium]
MALASDRHINHWKEAWPRTDFSRHTVPFDEIRDGGPPKDGIPAIDKPRFDSQDIAAKTLAAREPVIALELAGEAKAYPLSILMWHEIVNDRIGGVPVAVTFCPLCNASIVFDRRVGAREFDFGTTGKLRHSDLVMYDRQTETWWQQFTGAGIFGAHAGTVLKKIESQIVSFEEFRRAHPRARVLSRNTGYDRAYGRNPYQGYDSIDQTPFLLSSAPDARLPPMERVLSISVGALHRAYPFSVLGKTPVLNDPVGGEPMVVMSRPGTLSALDAAEIRNARQIASASAFLRRLEARLLSFESRAGGRIHDRETGSEWDLLGRALSGPLKGKRLTPAVSGVHFAFAWLVFRPNSEIYGK